MKQRLTKIIFFSLFLIYSLLLNVEAEPIKDQAKQAEGLTKMDIWESDSNTILSIISGLRHIEEESPTDSDLQKEHKAELRKKKYNEEFSRIKKVYYNKPFSLQAAMVTDVIPETKLNREGLREKRKVDAAAKTGNPKRDYLAVLFEKNQYKYRVETGNYEIRFSIPVPDSDGYSIFSKGIKKPGQQVLTVMIQRIVLTWI